MSCVFRDETTFVRNDPHTKAYHDKVCGQKSLKDSNKMVVKLYEPRGVQRILKHVRLFNNRQAHTGNA